MDRLTYKYAPKSNRLVDVHDTADIQSRFTLNGQTPAQYYGGFKDKHIAIDKYVYGDLNGNMTADKNKDITSITYNHLNLPSVVTFTNNRNITYIYDATGVKLKKVITQSATSTNTEYAGGIIYENGTLEMIPQPEGYIQPGVTGGYNYVYQYKDHLGNIRVSYSDLDGNNYVDSSEILSEKHYYPFGMTQKGYGAANSSMASSAALKYGFGGKELQDELGLEWYDITARNYDASLGRWMNIDPMAEKYYSESVYNYTMNNPVFFIDPDGKEVDVTSLVNSDDKDDFWLLTQLMLSLADISGQSITYTSTDDDRFILSGSGSCGAKCSEGSAYVSHLLSSDTETLAVKSTTTGSETFNKGYGYKTTTIFLDPTAIYNKQESLKNGKLDDRAVNAGFIFLHETLHTRGGASFFQSDQDQRDKRDGIFKDDNRATKPGGNVVDRVNGFRSEMNLPTRQRYVVYDGTMIFKKDGEDVKVKNYDDRLQIKH